MKRKTLLTLLAAMCASFTVTQAEPTYMAAEATKHVGETATVRDRVDGVHQSGKGNIFLNMGGKYPNQAFTAFIPSSSSAQFPQPQQYEGRTVAAVTPTPLPLGTFTLGSVETTDCPSSVAGWTCNDFTVSCPSTANITGKLAVKLSTAPTKAGMVVHYSGDDGALWWDGSPNPTIFSPTYFNNLLAAGYDVVQVKWSANGWTFAQPGVQTGQKLLSCRPATVAKWVHDNLWTPGSRFILTGSSGGSSQAAYSMLYLFSPNIVDLLIPDSGPPMADIFDGCVTGGIYDYGAKATLIDQSYGYPDGTGPCVLHDASYAAIWNANSNETCGPTLLYPPTVIHMIEGAIDTSSGPEHAAKYRDALIAVGQPVQYEVVPGMGHGAIKYATGEAALEAAIFADSPIPTPTPTPTPASSPTPTATATPTPNATPTPVPDGNPPTDFNHDGHPDYLLYNAGTRQTAVWYLNNNVYIGGAYAPTLPVGWRVIDAADFNRDGHPDYALFNASTRQTAIWYLSGVTFIGGAYGPTLPAGWELVATGNFNNDGKPDYVLYNASTHQTAVWYLNNNVYVGGVYGPTLPAGWSLVGVVDFDRDGHADYVLFHPSSGYTAIGYLSGLILIGAAWGPTLPSGWALVATADFNGDGKPDYVLYNASTHQTAVWYLNNNVYVGGAYGPTLPAGWSSAAP